LRVAVTFGARPLSCLNSEWGRVFQTSALTISRLEWGRQREETGRTYQTSEQIAAALRQLESGIPAVGLCRRLGVHENTISTWKKRFGSLGTPVIRELRQLREENTRLKRLGADLALDKTMPQDAI
jgi:putative transposase